MNAIFSGLGKLDRFLERCHELVSPPTDFDKERRSRSEAAEAERTASMNARRAEFGTLADICKGFHALQSALRKSGEHISIKTVDRPVYQLFDGLTPTSPPEGDNVHSAVKRMYGVFVEAEVGLQQSAKAAEGIWNVACECRFNGDGLVVVDRDEPFGIKSPRFEVARQLTFDDFQRLGLTAQGLKEQLAAIQQRMLGATV